jgi:DNA-binding transcriptional LysR family regulator
MRRSLDDIGIFVAVVDQGSFRGAAKRLDLSPSAVSKRLSALEQRLQVQLLQRTTRRLSLTQAGELLYEQVHAIPDALAAAEERLREAEGLVSGALRVVMPSYFESDLLYERVIPDYLDAHPAVSMTLTVVDDPLARLGEAFDLLVAGKLPNQKFPDSSAVGRRLLRLRGALFATSTYLGEHGRPEHPRDLASHNCLGYLNPQWHFTEPEGTSFVHTAEGNLRTNSNRLLRAATLADQGIAYSFPVFFQRDLAEGRVETLLDEYTAESYVALYVFYPAARFVPRRTREFIDTLVRHLSDEGR